MAQCFTRPDARLAIQVTAKKPALPTAVWRAAAKRLEQASFGCAVLCCVVRFVKTTGGCAALRPATYLISLLI